MNVIYLSADWCGPCKMFKPVVQQVSQESGVPIQYVNVDYDTSFTEKYNIKSIPTIIILDGSGQVLFQNSGVMSRDQLLSTLTKFK